MTKIQVRKQFTTTPVLLNWGLRLFSIWRRYKFESNSQRIKTDLLKLKGCFQYDEDTSSKAIHNDSSWRNYTSKVVFNMTKIQVRKQFTTHFLLISIFFRCFQYDEDTSSKAIHNNRRNTVCQIMLFSIWRRYKFESNSQQEAGISADQFGCFQYDEDTSSKAIHNEACLEDAQKLVVFNMTKIQVRKQFTT